MSIPASAAFRELWDAVLHDRQLTVPALPESALPFFIARLPAPQSGRSVVVVLAERRSSTLASMPSASAFWESVTIGGVPTRALPLTILPLLLPQERTGEIPTPRLRAFWQAVTSLVGAAPPRVILATTKELQQGSPGSADELNALVLQEKQKLAPTTLAARLLDLGYSEEKALDGPGTFARRGGIVDIFPFIADAPLRVEYQGNILDHLASLALPERNGRNGTDFVAVLAKAAATDSPRWLITPLEFPRKLPTTVGALLDRAYVIAEDGALPPGRSADLILMPFEHEARIAEAPTFAGDRKKVERFVRERVRAGDHVVLLTARPAAWTLEPPRAEPGTVRILPAETATAVRGFTVIPEHLIVLTDADIGEVAENPILSWETGTAYSRRFTVRDFVVHRDHGIARFRGIEHKLFEETARDYLVLEYSQRDRLYVPVELASKVTAYIGSANPVVHRLGGTEWENTTRAVRAEASDLARELLALYAARELESGTSYPPDTDADEKLARTFPYQETPDQAAAIREVKRDLERAQPMDHLVCGDVGFGKTEIAIRAAFKAVNFGRQTAVLSPTTLLAQQHYDTFRERLDPFGVRIALLSRLQSPADEDDILRRLAAGNVQILIGTHRLLSDDVRFKNLGLIIIDEEQKFGVAQKERLKNVRTSVDVLSLSATPIPRTLHMALSGLRSLSVIATAPTGRRPVITKVARESDALVKKALEDELRRSGQAYVLWNRVETIEAVAERIRSLVPKARVVIAHGQMPEDALMRVMEQFDTRRADVLVCSTIIENGIDLPNVNALIVFDAPSFGLSDLYQLRGRVGRGSQQAYAFFLYNQGRLPFEARKRLAALLEAVELGSGWTLALRDLEIRGAGNLLGREQHGTIRAVGVHLFSELLREEVDKLKSGTAVPSTQEVQIDIPVKAFLPETYIPNTDARLAAYNRLSAARMPADITAAETDLLNAYGPVPLEAATFLTLLRTKVLAVDAGVSAITESTVLAGPREATIPGNRAGRRITLTFRKGLTPTLAYAAITDHPRWTFTSSSMYIGTAELLATSGGVSLLERLGKTLRVLAQAPKTGSEGGGPTGQALSLKK